MLAAGAAAQTITDYPVPTTVSSPWGITAGPDGAMWFTETRVSQIGRITSNGTVTEFTVPQPSFGGGPAIDLTRGSDGAIWFGVAANLGRIDTAGHVSYFPAGAGPQGQWIKSGPDGALWFAEQVNRIGRMTPSGQYSEPYIADIDSYFHGLGFSPDGSLWVTLSGSPPDFTNLRHISLSGKLLQEFQLPDTLGAITAGPDGAMWFTTSNGIGRITASGTITFFAIPTANSGVYDLISGPDGALWFTESKANQLGRITTDGVVTEYPLNSAPPSSCSAASFGPVHIVTGPDGGLWFTEECANRIGHVTFAATAGKLAVGGTSPAQGSGTSTTFTFTFSESTGWQNLDVVNMLINSALDGRRACYLAYSVPSKTLVLVDDAGDAGGPYAGSLALGNSGTIQNSQCAVTLVSASGIGATLTLTVAVTFQPGFSGNLIQYLAARDSANNSGWQASGVWSSTSQPPAVPILIGSISPGRSIDAAGTMQTVTFTLSDTKGAADIGIVNLLVNDFIDGRHACYLAYVAAANTLLLVDDAGDAGGPFAGSLVLNGSPGTIQNSQCAVSGQGSSVVTNGNQVTVNLALTFLPSMAGNRVFWVAGRDGGGGSNTGWQAMGTASIAIQ